MIWHQITVWCRDHHGCSRGRARIPYRKVIRHFCGSLFSCIEILKNSHPPSLAGARSHALAPLDFFTILYLHFLRPTSPVDTHQTVDDRCRRYPFTGHTPDRRRQVPTVPLFTGHTPDRRRQVPTVPLLLKLTRTAAHPCTSLCICRLFFQRRGL